MSECFGDRKGGGVIGGVGNGADLQVVVCGTAVQAKDPGESTRGRSVSSTPGVPRVTRGRYCQSFSLH